MSKSSAVGLTSGTFESPESLPYVEDDEGASLRESTGFLSLLEGFPSFFSSLRGLSTLFWSEALGAVPDWLAAALNRHRGGAKKALGRTDVVEIKDAGAHDTDRRRVVPARSTGGTVIARVVALQARSLCDHALGSGLAPWFVSIESSPRRRGH